MTQPSVVVDRPRSSWSAGSAIATIVASRTTTNCATQRSATIMWTACPSIVTIKRVMVETAVERPPSAANMRLDGGHPALELVNTIYGQVGGPVEHDVLATPEDLVTLARRLGFADADTPASPRALADARALRDTVDALLRAGVAGEPPPAAAVGDLERAARAALEAATLAP